MKEKRTGSYLLPNGATRYFTYEVEVEETRTVATTDGREVAVAVGAPDPPRALNTQPKRRVFRTARNAADRIGLALLKDWNKLRKGQDLEPPLRPCPIEALLATKAWKGAEVTDTSGLYVTVRHPSGAVATMAKGAAWLDRDVEARWWRVRVEERSAA
jgi:hypothetical protein